MSVSKLAHLMSRTIKNDNGCMEFVGHLHANGYGRATVNNKTDYAHRHVYRLVRGEIPPKIDVCHSCDNRKCINIHHLFLGTRKENMQDAIKKGRQAKGFKLPQAKLEELQKTRIVELAKLGIPYKKIAEFHGICVQRAGQIALKAGVKRYVR